MKKLFIANVFLLVVLLALSPGAMAATTDFTANANITVSDVTFGQTTADMFIFDESTSESWSFNSGAFTVTNPGSAFKIGSTNEGVGAIQIILDSASVSCNANTVPGTTYVTLPTAAGTYTIVPHATTACTSACATVSHAATYNMYPTCGVATCEAGYDLSSGTCVGRSVISSPSGGSSGSTPSQEKPKTETKTIEADKNTNGTETKQIEQTTSAQDKLEQIKKEANILVLSQIETLISTMGTIRNLEREQNVKETFLDSLLKKVKTHSAKIQEATSNFITYGTQTTKSMGEGERAGVLNSFQKAYNRLPEKDADWQDAIKIANGRFPAQQSIEKEKGALKVFAKIYKKMPDFKNSHDEAALKIIAYGIRPATRRTESEKSAIKSFKGIYGKNPSTTEDWDIMRAIAYSGATR